VLCSPLRCIESADRGCSKGGAPSVCAEVFGGDIRMRLRDNEGDGDRSLGEMQLLLPGDPRNNFFRRHLLNAHWAARLPLWVLCPTSRGRGSSPWVVQQPEMDPSEAARGAGRRQEGGVQPSPSHSPHESAPLSLRDRGDRSEL
jgi:hypothetical protein